MKILSVHINNFLTIREADVQLADRGLVLIQGCNEEDSSADSNGAGKSSLPDAVSWCLFGVTARGEDGDKVVNRAAGKDCSVSVYIQDDDQLFRVDRYRKHKQHKNAVHLIRIDKAGAFHDLTKGTNALTDAEIVKLVGASHDVFKAAVYAGQESFPDLPGMTDKQLKMLVEEAAGVTVLEAAYREANSRLNQAKQALEAIGQKLNTQKIRLSDAQNSFLDLQDGSKQFEADRKKAVADLQDCIRDADDSVTNYDKALRKFDKPMTLAVIKRIEAQIAAVESERVRERQLQSDANLAQNQVNMLTADLQRMKREAESLKQHIHDLSGAVGCPCETCARPYTAEDIAPAKQARATDLRAKVEAFKTRKLDLDRAVAAHKSVADALQKHRASMTDISAANLSLSEMRVDLASIENLERQRQQHVDRAGDYRKRVLEENKKPNPFLPRMEKLLEGIQVIQDQLTDLEKAQNEAIEAQKTAEIVAKIFSPSGVRAFILDEVTPFLNDQTAKYLGVLSDGNISATWSTLVPNAKGELKEKFSIEVTHAKGGETFRSISGGEKRKVRIAAALALQDLVARRATKPIELFVGDEIDDALDPAGLERLVQILEEKARERGSVFVISHSDLKDWVSNVITVVKKAPFTSIIEESIA